MTESLVKCYCGFLFPDVPGKKMGRRKRQEWESGGGCDVLKDDRSGFRLNDFRLERKTDEVIKVKHLGEKKLGVFLSNGSVSLTLSLSFPVCVSSPSAVCQRMPRKAVCLFSLGGMSESTEKKDERKR